MYGLVNQAIEQMIRSRYGKETWEEIKQRAGIDVREFISMESYADDVSYSLVGAASQVLGESTDTLLEAFGEYWTLYTAEAGYGEIFRMGGSTFKEFMLNLHTLHTNVALGFPQLKPPSFWCTNVTDNSLRLHYQTKRTGLRPMVVGLIKGLGRRFNTMVEVRTVRTREHGADHDEFDITFL